MPAGFFSESKLATSRAPTFIVPRCGACGLLKSCQTPKMPIYGNGGRRVLIVGANPRAADDAAGSPFRSTEGLKLRATLESLGYDLRRDCWATNAIICRPESNKLDVKRIDYCRPNLTRAIAELQPVVIIPLGAYAVRSVLAPVWKSDTGESDKWAGWQIPMHRPNVWVCPTWAAHELTEPVADLWWKKHLKRAFRLKFLPWNLTDGPPDYAKQIECVLDPDDAARKITARMLLGDFPAAFDYETNKLKPDDRRAEIVCCSISWEGRYTIAYPWAGAAIDATRRFLESPAPKRGSNIKFEDRWSRAMLGVTPRNWEWDTMLAAHVADNRRGITSVKFQALARLGVPVWNSHLEHLLKSDGDSGNAPNRVRQIDLRQLLLYCGLDSLLEWLVSEDQRKELRYEKT